MVSTLEKTSKFLTKIMKVCMVVLLIWMTFAMTVQVVARYIFSKGFVWTDESTRYCMIWLIFIGATEIIFNGDHIKVTVIEDLLRGVGKKVIILIQYIAGLVFSVIMAVYSFPQVKLAAKAVSSNMNINMGIVYGIFPVVTILMIVGYIVRIILMFAKKNEEGEAA